MDAPCEVCSELLSTQEVTCTHLASEEMARGTGIKVPFPVGMCYFSGVAEI